ncbi:MAG: glutamate 5-kinase [Chromatiales bacterium]|nr:glutamate 5-kinase [Chromatiales bacterium]
MNENIKNKCWIIKIGSSLVTRGGCGLNLDAIHIWSMQIRMLRDRGYRIGVVSSGSIAEGIHRLGWRTRPDKLHHLQAAAAVGQIGLMQAYHSIFEQQGLGSAQILLTHADLSHRLRYNNARATLLSLFEIGTVPIINENDTVATEEIRLGDNDTLAAQVANLVDADILLMLTDQAGLYDGDPAADSHAKVVSHKNAFDPALDKIAGPSASGLGRGGMITKIKAARTAAWSGTSTIIAHGMEDQVMVRIADGEKLGTYLEGTSQPITLRKRWIANLKAQGALIIDNGAVWALRDRQKSLLPIGVVAVEGSFNCGDMVLCKDSEGAVIAYGLSNYNAQDARSIAGKNSYHIEALMGDRYKAEIIHRDNLTLKGG